MPRVSPAGDSRCVQHDAIASAESGPGLLPRSFFAGDAAGSSIGKLSGTGGVGMRFGCVGNKPTA
ncbi:hypothetical protein NG796_25955 [Laspinema sp. A4]|uniref:hypothetical protein n=1 Tax=Laspinema sp. D2d TaxID=2953686 RepID=UPI0021BA5107|nr:hypothetical protein [Laspinema sp. D2d]MCT7986723.1 hypothetical protein [Laspinema sp. D2d]